MVALLAATAAAGPAATDGVGSRATAAGAGKLGDAQLAGQRIVTGFEGRQAPDSLKERIRAGRLAGVILFSENFDTAEQARRLVADLQAIPRPHGLRSPLLVMIDQEGGQVKRLPGAPSRSAEEMGRAGRDACRGEGAATGRNLRGVGVNVDLAPVLDVARPGSAIEREDRAFGRKPQKVSGCANAFARGLDRERVAPTAKHFPGIGAASVNTDDAVQRIRLRRSKLRRTDERPYRRFVGKGAPGRLVMVSSAIYPAFSDRPASFARALATRELRGRLEFEGVSITDALNSASARAFGGPARVARLAADAGTDLLLFADFGSAKQAANALRDRLDHGGANRDRFKRSVGRVLHLRRGLG